MIRKYRDSSHCRRKLQTRERGHKPAQWQASKQTRWRAAPSAPRKKRLPLLALQLHVLQAGSANDFEGVFSKLKDLAVGALAISPANLFAAHSEDLAALTVRHALPAVYQFRCLGLEEVCDLALMKVQGGSRCFPSGRLPLSKLPDRCARNIRFHCLVLTAFDGRCRFVPTPRHLRLDQGNLADRLCRVPVFRCACPF